jgi:hypothetical protein
MTPEQRQRWDERERNWRAATHYAVCSAGHERWFWMAWTDYNALCAGDMIATGYAATRAAAVTAAVTAAGPEDGAGPAGFAAQQLPRINAKIRLEAGSTRTDTQPLHLVYNGHWQTSDYDGRRYWYAEAHRVVKITRTRYYVDRECYFNGKGEPRQPNPNRPVETFTLDREQLETTGSTTRGHGWYNEYFLSPDPPARAPISGEVPAYLAALGLDGTASKVDVRRAYRRLVKTAHPDAGGDESRFIEIQRAYEQALIAVA